MAALELAPLHAPNADDHAPQQQPMGEADANALWINTNHARLMKKHAANKTRIETLKFQLPHASLTRTHAHGGNEAMSSPSTQLRHDRIEWDAPHRMEEEEEEEVEEEEEEVIISLDDEDTVPGVRRRREDDANEEHKEASRRHHAEENNFEEHKENARTRRMKAAAGVTAAMNEQCAGSVPAIVVDPFCSLLLPSRRPHLVPDASMRLSARVSSSQPAPAIWATDYARHTVRCVLADGQIHTVAGVNDMASDPKPGFADGTGTLSALFAKPRGLVLHPLTGELFIADSANHCIRVVTSPTLVMTALRRAGRDIEDASSFRMLRDPTVDPAIEEAREMSRLKSKKSSPLLATSVFPTPELASSLRVVLSLFLPLIVDFVGFEVRTIAGTPGQQGCRDTLLDSHGGITQQAQFKFPIGLCLRMIGQVSTEENDVSANVEELKEVEPSSLSTLPPPRPPAAPSANYELLVSDAGNGCIRRIRQNPFGPPRSASPSSRRARSLSPSPALEDIESSGFIVETIRAFVPIRCCHTSWMPNEDEQRSNSSVGSHDREEHKESSSSPPLSSSPVSSFGSSLLSSPSRLLSSSSAAREYIRFQYPIGIALRVETSRSRSGDGEVTEEAALYGKVYTIEEAAKERNKDANQLSASSPDQLASPSPPLAKRIYAPRCSLIIVDARAACVYSMDLDTGSVKRLAGSDEGGWGFVDGPGARARFCRPSGAVVDQRTGDIIVADAGNHCIRLIAARSNRVSTIAGHPHRVGCVDGPAFAATFYAPLAVALSPCPFYPQEHDQVVWVAGGYRQGVRKIVRCQCKWTYETS